MKAKAALLAFLFLTVAVCGSGGSIDPNNLFASTINLILALAALALTIAAFALPDDDVDSAFLSRVLAVLAAVMLFWLAFKPPLGPYWHGGMAWPVFAAALTMAVAAAWPRLSFWRTPVILLAYALLSGWLILAVATDLNVDTRVVQEYGCRYLSQGINPYAMTYPDPRDLEHPINFPYPPLNLLMVLPGYWLGDIRWGLIAALLATMGLLTATGRKLEAGQPAELTMLALLANPWGVAVVILAWTDPQLSLFIALAGWAHATGRRHVLLLALAGLISVKQYGILFLPAFWLLGRLGWRDGLKIAGLAAVPVAPFLLWGPQDFWQGVVGMHLVRPFRETSLSVLALVAVTTGVKAPALIGFAAALTALAYVGWKGVASLANAALANAMIFLAFILFNQDAHLNYFWLALVCLAQGLIGCLARRREDASASAAAAVPS